MTAAKTLMAIENNFFMVAKEYGENSALPIWANRRGNPIGLAQAASAAQVSRVAITAVPGAFHLRNVLSLQECKTLLALTRQLGYHPDAPVSLPREIRHNDNLVWIADIETLAILWARVAAAINQDVSLFDNDLALGLNGRFRFYRYSAGDFFKFHSDGAWTGSLVVNGQLQPDAFGDRLSRMTFLLLLNDDYEGGATRFRVNADDPMRPIKHYSKITEVDVHTAAGDVLCFPHGLHPLHCVHSGETISHGEKFILRTDVLFPV